MWLMTLFSLEHHRIKLQNVFQTQNSRNHGSAFSAIPPVLTCEQHGFQIHSRGCYLLHFTSFHLSKQTFFQKNCKLTQWGSIYCWCSVTYCWLFALKVNWSSENSVKNIKSDSWLCRKFKPRQFIKTFQFSWVEYIDLLWLPFSRQEIFRCFMIYEFFAY